MDQERGRARAAPLPADWRVASCGRRRRCRGRNRADRRRCSGDSYRRWARARSGRAPAGIRVRVSASACSVGSHRRRPDERERAARPPEGRTRERRLRHAEAGGGADGGRTRRRRAAEGQYPNRPGLATEPAVQHAPATSTRPRARSPLFSSGTMVPNPGPYAAAAYGLDRWTGRLWLCVLLPPRASRRRLREPRRASGRGFRGRSRALAARAPTGNGPSAPSHPPAISRTISLPRRPSWRTSRSSVCCCVFREPGLLSRRPAVAVSATSRPIRSAAAAAVCSYAAVTYACWRRSGRIVDGDAHGLRRQVLRGRAAGCARSPPVSARAWPHRAGSASVPTPSRPRRSPPRHRSPTGRPTHLRGAGRARPAAVRLRRAGSTAGSSPAPPGPAVWTGRAAPSSAIGASAWRPPAE